MPMQFSRIVLLDDEDRENEGDLDCAYVIGFLEKQRKMQPPNTNRHWGADDILCYTQPLRV
jgi:hypothetical protein